MKSFIIFKIIIFYVFIFIPFSSISHEIKPSVADISIQNSIFVIKINTNIEAILSNIDLSDVKDTDLAENKDIYDSYRKKSPLEIKVFLENNSKIISENINLSVDNVRKDLIYKEIKIIDNQNYDLPRESEIYFHSNIPENSKKYKISWSKKYGDLVIRDFSLKDNIFSEYLVSGNFSKEIHINKIKKQSIFQIIKNYMIIGFKHIVPLGLDHILFILGIYLVIYSFKDLFVRISIFTLAHTFSFALSSLSIIIISPKIIEPLIALSITYIAIENIFFKNSNFRRLLLIFCFGLIHGLGFSYMLNDYVTDYQNFLISMISFNLGVELGQLFLVFIFFILFGLWFKKKKWYRKVFVIPLSCIMAIISIFWFFERILN